MPDFWPPPEVLPIPLEDVLTTKEELIARRFTSGIKPNATTSEGQCAHAHDVIYAAIMGNRKMHITPPSAQITPLTGGYHVSTRFETPWGPEAIGELRQTCQILDDFGTPEEIQAMSEVCVAPLYAVKYVPFGAQLTASTSFRCTADQLLEITTSGLGLYKRTTFPDKKQRRVSWLSFCCHDNTRTAESITDLDTSDPQVEQFRRQRIYTAWPGDIEDEPGYTSASDPDFEDMGSDSDVSDNDEEDIASKSFMTEEEISEFFRIPSIREALSTFRLRQQKRCRCGVFRTVNLTLPNAELANTLYRILRSNQWAQIDPLMVRKGERFAVTAKQLAENPHISDMRDFVRLFRHNVSTLVAGGLVKLPVEPFIVGLWFGDGCKSSFSIASCDPEIRTEMEAAVFRANESRPSGKDPLKLTQTLVRKPGEISMIGTQEVKATKECFLYRISATSAYRSQGYYNPYSDFLKDHNLLGSKAAGIPEPVFHTSVHDRLEFLAGLICSDGNYCSDNDTYEFSQKTEEHFPMVHDAARLARELGIHVYGPYAPRSPHRIPQLRIVLTGSNIEKLQPHLRIPSKLRTRPKQSGDRSVRGIKSVTLTTPGPYRSLKTISGKLTLEGGVIVPDCQKNAQDQPSFMTDAEHEDSIREYHDLVAERVLELMSNLGVRHFDDLAGRYDLLYP